MPDVEDSEGQEEAEESYMGEGQEEVGTSRVEDGQDTTPDGPNESPERSGATDEEDPVAALRERVNETYDFEEFTPADMAEMSGAEWEAVFDPEAWITGEKLIDRIEVDLTQRVAKRDIFAVIERPAADRILAYSDTGYAIVHGSGRIEGEGSILREVEPVVALCAMEKYEVEGPPVDQPLPEPEEIEEGTGRLGHILLQVVAGAQVLGGMGLLLAPLFTTLPGDDVVVLTTAAGLGFLVLGVLLFVLVANARLSGRFRAEEYRDRLEAAGVGREERPAFVPNESDEDAAAYGGTNGQ